MSDDYALPADIADAVRAYTEMMAFIRRRKITTGGCRAFYSPREWAARNEKYGLDAVLIVVHDGGGLAPACNLDYQDYQLHDALQKQLAEAGFYLEGCTTWYSAIYKTERSVEKRKVS